MSNTKPQVYMIHEHTNFSKPTIISANDSVIIEAELQNSLEFNRNKRNYPYAVLDKALNSKKIVELIQNQSWVGEAGHPLKPTIERQMGYETSNISHRVNKWWWDNGRVMGHVETMNYGEGIRMKNYILQGLNTAFSLRAVGPIKQTSKGKVVLDPLNIQCYDWVFVPSHENSYQKNIIYKPGDTNYGINPNLSESICVPLQESALDYIREESKHIEIITESLEFSGVMSLSDDLKQIIIESFDPLTNSKSTLVSDIEPSVSNEINSYFSKLF